MLVLSRRVDQKVSFPGLGITVQILGVKGNNVKVGVDAPLEIRVIRDELAEQEPTKGAIPDSTEKVEPKTHIIRLPKDARHALRNQLNTLSIALHMFKQQIDSGYDDDAEDTFDRLVSYLENLSSGEFESNSTSDSQSATSPDAPRPFRALLVEDEENEREMLAGILRMKGYEVVTAGDGIEALSYLEDNDPPDVVLIDMRMPRQDGPTTIRKIRSNERFDRTKVFAVSGSLPPEVGIDTKRDGVNRWFCKPLNPRSLVDAMVEESFEPNQSCTV